QRVVLYYSSGGGAGFRWGSGETGAEAVEIGGRVEIVPEGKLTNAQVEGVRAFQRLRKDVFGTPGDGLEQRGLPSFQAEEIVAAVLRRAENEIGTLRAGAQRVEGGAKGFGGQVGAVRADQNAGLVAQAPGGFKDSVHPGSQVAVRLGNTGQTGKLCGEPVFRFEG